MITLWLVDLNYNLVWMWLVDLNNFECDWLNELPDNKLSGNNLASELVENMSFF